MDVTPQLLKEVEFREKFRGYDPDEVDDFLERVGIAFSQLQEKVHESSDQIEAANARAARAEARARDSSDADDTLRRTLVLAQRTADAAIKEAEENAASIVAAAEAQARQTAAGAEERAAQSISSAEERAAQSIAAAEERAAQSIASAEETARRAVEAADAEAAEKVRTATGQAESELSNARGQSSQLLVEARTRADKIITDAEAVAVKSAQEKLDRLNAEIGELDERRDTLAHDVSALDSHAINHRNSLSAVLDQLRSLVEDPHLLGQVPLPELQAGPIEDAAAMHARRQRGELVEPAGSAAAANTAATPAATVAAVPVSRDDVGRDVPVPGADSGPSERPEPTTPLGDAPAPVAAGADGVGGSQAAVPLARAEGDATDEGPAPSTGAARPLPPVSSPTGDRPSTGLSSPLSPAASPVGSAAPPWMGTTPPPPPPPPPLRTGEPGDTIDEAATIPPPPPPLAGPPPAPSPWAPPAATPAATPAGAAPAAAEADTPRDSFLDELRRAVGEEPAEGDEATRFFEDRDPTDPAVRFFEDGDDSRTRFRRR